MSADERAGLLLDPNTVAQPSLPVKPVSAFNLSQSSEDMTMTPQQQHMDEISRPPLINTTGNLCCPSALSCLLGFICPCGWLSACYQVNEREEVVLLNFGQYLGVLRAPGLYCLNPFGMDKRVVSSAVQTMEIPALKVVDFRGNPLRISGVVTYQIIEAKCAAIDVGSWNSYLSTQAEVVLKQICASHPYESDKVGEDSLKREADKVRQEIKQLLQMKANIAGIKIMNFEFKELSYAPEIAAQMLVRQQAEAMLAARKIVVEGAVSLAWDAIHHLKEAGIDYPNLEAARLASNLVVTICSEARVQPMISLN